MRPDVGPVPVDRRAVSTHLPDWDYADAYEIAVARPGPDSAMSAAVFLFDLAPLGRATLRIRDAIVRAASLKPALDGTVGLFPVLHATDDFVVLGLDDRHLDFRVLVDVRSGRVRCTTAVRRHGWSGRAYFGVVAPFHRRVIPHLLARSERHGWCTPSAARIATSP